MDNIIGQVIEKVKDKTTRIKNYINEKPNTSAAIIAAGMAVLLFFRIISSFLCGRHKKR